jgi:hypothetical protein
MYMPADESKIETDITRALEVARRYGHQIERSAFKLNLGSKDVLTEGECATCGGSIKVRASRAVDLPTSCRKPDLPWVW